MPQPAKSVTVGPFLAACGALEREKQKLHAAMVATLAETTDGWKDVLVEDVTVDHIGGAMTNLIFKLAKPSGVNKEVLVRIYGEGTEAFFSRQAEMHLFQHLALQNIGIGFLGQFANGRVEKVIQGTTLTSKEMHEPAVSADIATKLRQFHALEADIDQSPRFLNEIWRMLDVARARCTSKEILRAVDFAQFELDIKELEREVEAVASPVVLCHNDLQYGNIMRTDAGVVLIDFEYSSYNPRGYDIGNHFCEWAYDYHKAVDCHLGDWSKYPTVEEQRNFCRAYLQGDSEVESESTDADVEQLRREASTYSLGPHLFWALWGFIQASQSEIDFDFLAYGLFRYEAFKNRVTLQISP